MTRAQAVDFIKSRATEGGHKLGKEDKGIKWIAVCRKCGAMAIVEMVDDRIAYTSYGAFGGVLRRSCAAIRGSKRRRAERRQA